MSKRCGDANENNVLEFINISGPPQKRQRRVAQPVTEATQAEAQRVWQEQHQAEAAARAKFTAAREREAEAERRATSKIRVGHVLQAVKAAGYGSLYGFLDDLVTTKDQNHSSQVSQMLISHGDELLTSIRSRQPEVVSQWISKVAGNILAEEGAKLAQHLRPRMVKVSPQQSCNTVNFIAMWCSKQCKLDCNVVSNYWPVRYRHIAM
ncbi:hypothetical protein B0H14DRAFT_2613611 [Mycena olivaceomarginata]|nr:hypothetical protein B0H14DRAFT_2613611 [Mycena olivaceomarginata]